MNRLLTLSMLCLMWGSLSAYQSADSFLKELDEFLTPKQMSKIISDEFASKIASLAEKEDMEVSDNYLVSDELLRLLRRGGVLNTELGKLLEDFQSECDRLEKNERDLAIAKWKALWLEKASTYLRHVRSLKRLWAVDFSHSVDHDSNILQGDPSDPVTQFNSGKDDYGTTFKGGLTLRPLINMPKNRNWRWNVNFNGTYRIQAKEEALEYSSAGLRNSLSFSRLSKLWTSFSISHEYLGTSLKSSPNSGQHIIGLNSRFMPMVKGPLGFNNGINNIGFQVRLKNEDSSSTSAEEDVQVFSLSYGQNFMKTGKSNVFQTIGWTLRYESQSADPTATRLDTSRDTSVFDLGLSYSRSLPTLSDRYNFNWRSSLNYRIKDWDTASATNETEQNQVSLSTALSARWNTNFTSNLSLSYMNKDSDISDPLLPTRTSSSVDQWRVVFANTFLTF
jgi:hypothetical protein